MITAKPNRLLLSLLPFVAACSSLNPVGTDEFNCPGMGPGACTSPANAYAMSNGSMDEVKARINRHSNGERIDAESVLREANANNNIVRKGASNVSAYGSPDGSIAGVPPELALQSDSATPVRLPAQVMRIRIFPWTDSFDNLHSGGYIYTEIEPRKWSFGLLEEGVSRNSRVPHAMTGQAPESLTPDESDHMPAPEVIEAQPEPQQTTGVDLSNIGLGN